ncbi:CDP-diacylglycerol--serine O-phosphatidyltransferase [Hyphomicrobium sp. 99]|uniref:CDP-diacylglycerol--serine O-phosphatidyltransferase n=1 Tax=Hyphomicrobium sp. 99 TaxID=1163419 RepID=UPI0005F84F07|nr:CDP-diacylglycerol--serine O-phosphatidyltransferase [Hyphomicrobium sp. 99]
MDTDEPFIETETRRRRRRSLFRHRRVPVRMLVPNFFTLLGLCAGLTSIRMGIEGRYDLALAAIVFAACLDGIDGRIARLLKASSRFGAELDSLADFVNFGVAPAFLIFNWGLGDLKSAGWICVMIFALASALRLARFNAALDDDKPKWQSNYFMGMPTPAAAIAVLLPLYLDQLGLADIKTQWALKIVLVYTVFIAFMMVSSIPTYSGKLVGERVGREWVLPIFVVAIGIVAFLFTYPYETLTALTVLYLAFIPASWRNFRDRSEGESAAAAAAQTASPATETPANEQGTGRIFTFRPTDPTK